MRTQSCKAYAKINLTLDITGRRADGYHEIETVMHTISLCDTVTVKPVRRPGITLRCNLPYVPCDERNIAYKAAAAFFERTGRPSGILIDLRKRIPVGAGMAGGSTDAAAVLRLRHASKRQGAGGAGIGPGGGRALLPDHRLPPGQGHR